MDNSKIIEEFRKNHGKVGGMFEGMNILLVTAIGAKSGKEITFPVAYTIDDGQYIIVASKGGAPENPSWYYNLTSHPQVVVELGDEKFNAVAKETINEERERLFDLHAKVYPTFYEYKAKTSRVIPVFLLKRA
jgi:deazaflavin-dependent oxidoreductase (nitroreductase family)